MPVSDFAKGAPVPRFILLFLLYVSQYLGIGFLFNGATAILRTLGASLESLSMVTALGLVWAVKFLWAPLIDRWGRDRVTGHYRAWLLVLQPLMAVVLVAMGFLSDLAQQFGIFLLTAAIYVALSATQDIAADALAVRVIQPHERGLVNGIQVAGGYLGNIIGGGLTALVYEWAGWQTAMVTLAALTLLPTVAIWLFREPDVAAQPAPHAPASLRTLWTVTRQSGARMWMFVAVPLMWGSLTAAYSLIIPALVDSGWSVGQIGLLLTTFGSAVGFLSALGTGWLITRIGRRETLLVAGVLTCVGLAMFIPMANGWAPTNYAVVTIGIFFAAYTAGSTIVYMINMDYARLESPGTDFTTLSSFGMVVSFAAGAISLNIAGAVGFVPVFVCCVVLFAVGTALTVEHQGRHHTAELNAEARGQTERGLESRSESLLEGLR